MNSVDQVTQVVEPGLDPRLRILRCGQTVDTFAVVTTRYLVVVDTMVSRDAMAAGMELLQPDLVGRQLLVVNSHGDWDHVWGNGLFLAPDAPFPAPVIGTRLTAETMSSERAAGFLRTFRAEHPGRYDSAGYYPPTIRFERTLDIAGGDLTLHLFPAPGHKPDQIAIWIPEIGTLLVADAAELPMPLVNDAHTLPELRATLANLASFPAQTVLYCHAGTTSPDVIQRNLAYFDELERRARAGEPAPALDDVLPAGYAFADDEQRAFYQRAHDNAVRVVQEWVHANP